MFSAIQNGKMTMGDQNAEYDIQPVQFHGTFASEPRSPETIDIKMNTPQCSDRGLAEPKDYLCRPADHAHHG